MNCKNQVKKFPEPQNRHRSVKIAFETLANQTFQTPRVRTTASIRED